MRADVVEWDDERDVRELRVRYRSRLRDMLALEDGDALWLAGGTPRRWLESKDGIRVNNLVTYFGSVSYTMRSGSEPRLNNWGP